MTIENNLSYTWHSGFGIAECILSRLTRIVLIDAEEDIFFPKKVYESQKCIPPSPMDKMTVFVVDTGGNEDLFVLWITPPRMLGSQDDGLEGIVMRRSDRV